MIHPSADVAADAQIGATTKIWHRAQVRERAAIGEDCVIGKDVYIDHDVRVGDRVKIQIGAIVGHGVTIESGVFVGPHVILTNDVYPRSITPDGSLASADDWQVTPTIARYGSAIGAGAVIVAGSDIGAYAMVAAGAIVTRHVPDHALVVGNPARQIGWMCVCGRRLLGPDGDLPAPVDARSARCPVDGRRFEITDGHCRARGAPGIAAAPPMIIPLSRPEFGPAEEEAVAQVMRSGQLAMGPRTAEFESAWADYCGVRHAVMMANGTVAMEALLRGLGLGPGDEVITVSFSFNATVSTILQVGATPVFVDVREDDFCIDPSQVASAITPRTKAILPVHLYGQMADMAPLQRIAEQNALVIIEDAAQAHGAAYHGRKAGSFGPAMFSLYATKNLACGEGGMITTDDGQLADWLRVYRNHGMRQRYHHDALGTNFKPTDLAAGIGLAQLASLDVRNSRRAENAARFSRELRGCVIPSAADDRTHVWHQYTIRLPGVRDRVRDALAEGGVGALVYYPIPIHRQAYIRERWPHLAVHDLPITDRLASEVLSIPVRSNLVGAEIERVIDAVNATISETGLPA